MKQKYFRNESKIVLVFETFFFNATNNIFLGCHAWTTILAVLIQESRKQQGCVYCCAEYFDRAGEGKRQDMCFRATCCVGGSFFIWNLSKFSILWSLAKHCVTFFICLQVGVVTFNKVAERPGGCFTHDLALATPSNVKFLKENFLRLLKAEG